MTDHSSQHVNPWDVPITPVQRDQWASTIACQLKPNHNFVIPQATLGQVTQKAEVLSVLEYDCIGCHLRVKIPNSRWSKDSNQKELERREGYCLDCRFNRGLV